MTKEVSVSDYLKSIGTNMSEMAEAQELVEAEGEPTYKIIRFRQNDDNEVIKTGLTLAEAREHCSDDTSKGDDWFDGYTMEG